MVVSPSQPWNPVDIETVRRGLVAGLTRAKIGAQLGKSKSAISGLIYRLNSTMPAPPPKPQPPLDSDSNCAKTRRILQ